MTKTLSLWCAFCLLLVVSPVEPTVAIAADGWFARVCNKLLLKTEKSAVEILWAGQDVKTWTAMAQNFNKELAGFRMLSEFEKNQKLQIVASEVETSIVQKMGHKKIGFHYNLHGGARDSYHIRGGIQAQMGDSGVAGGFTRDFARKVYFFNLEKTDLLTILTTRNPNILFPRMRMGHVLILFDLNSPALKEARELGVITKVDEIFMDFDEAAARKQNLFFGVERRAFLLRPLAVFDKKSRPLIWRDLNWDEETLLYLRFIEAEMLQIDPA